MGASVIHREAQRVITKGTWAECAQHTRYHSQQPPGVFTLSCPGGRVLLSSHRRTWDAEPEQTYAQVGGRRGEGPRGTAGTLCAWVHAQRCPASGPGVRPGGVTHNENTEPSSLSASPTVPLPQQLQWPPGQQGRSCWASPTARAMRRSLWDLRFSGMPGLFLPGVHLPAPRGLFKIQGLDGAYALWT